MAYEVIKREKHLHPDVQPLLIVLTDGAGNVSIGKMPPQEEAYQLAELIAMESYRSVVINMEHAAFDQGLAAVTGRSPQSAVLLPERTQGRKPVSYRPAGNGTRK